MSIWERYPTVTARPTGRSRGPTDWRSRAQVGHGSAVQCETCKALAGRALLQLHRAPLLLRQTLMSRESLCMLETHAEQLQVLHESRLELGTAPIISSAGPAPRKGAAMAITPAIQSAWVAWPGKAPSRRSAWSARAVFTPCEWVTMMMGWPELQLGSSPSPHSFPNLPCMCTTECFSPKSTRPPLRA
eukprot:scaffold295506_cov32-Tisochrysis_lutea.AAC.1